MKYNLSENIHKLTDEFIEKRIPAKVEDKQLYAKYMEAIDAGEERLPVFKGTEGADADYRRAILSTGKSVCDIFPENDAMKVQSCINLFDSVSEIPELKEVKKKNHWIG